MTNTVVNEEKEEAEGGMSRGLFWGLENLGILVVG